MLETELDFVKTSFSLLWLVHLLILYLRQVIIGGKTTRCESKTSSAFVTNRAFGCDRKIYIKSIENFIVIFDLLELLKVIELIK